jgi:hypothetical protein
MSIIKQSTFDASVARLRAKFSNPAAAEIAVAAFSEGWEVLPDAHPTFADRSATSAPAVRAPAVEPESGKSARQAEFDALYWQATVAGKHAKEAARLATNELARRHGEPVNPDNMSFAELADSLRGMDPSVLGLPSDNDAPQTDEEFAAGLADLAASMADENTPIGVSMDNVAATVAHRQAQADHDQAVNSTVAAIQRSNPTMDATLIRQMAETAIGPVKVAAAKPTGAEALAGMTWAELGIDGRD